MLETHNCWHKWFKIEIFIFLIRKWEVHHVRSPSWLFPITYRQLLMCWRKFFQMQPQENFFRTVSIISKGMYLALGGIYCPTSLLYATSIVLCQRVSHRTVYTLSSKNEQYILHPNMSRYEEISITKKHLQSSNKLNHLSHSQACLYQAPTLLPASRST